MTIRVIIVDDQAMVRAGFAALLCAQADIDVVGEAPDGREGVRVARTVHPDVVLMDVRMPEMDGLAAAREILTPPHGRGPPAEGADADHVRHRRLRVRGAARGRVRLPPQGRSGQADLIAAVRIVASGEALLAPSVTRRLIADFVERR